MSSIRVRTKQAALDELCKLLDAGPMELSPGSTVPAEIFYLAARRVGVEPSGSMPEVAEAIVKAAGLEWGRECDSRHTPSGGGSTVTLAGMQRLIEALQANLPTQAASTPSPSSEFGKRYVPAVGGISAPDKAVIRNWDALDKATRLHADTQNALAALVSSRGLETITPRPGLEPNFDLGWKCSEGTVVVEVKTVHEGNRRQQVRLGLGQVLDYRWHVQRIRSGSVVAVLATNATISDEERSFCADSGVVTASAESFLVDLADLLTPPK